MFKTIGHKFEVFDQDTTDVLAPYGDGKALIQRIWDMQEEYREPKVYKQILRQARPYMISLFEWQKDRLTETGLLYSALEGRLLILDESAYDGQCGLTEVKERPVKDFVI